RGRDTATQAAGTLDQQCPLIDERRVDSAAAQGQCRRIRQGARPIEGRALQKQRCLRVGEVGREVGGGAKEGQRARTAERTTLLIEGAAVDRERLAAANRDSAGIAEAARAA